jgi:lipopolysaccharide biosynthesis glycosyltransferase
MNKETLNVVFTIDENFVRHFSVALVSLLESNKDLNLNIYIIHDIENLSQLNFVLDSFSNKYVFKHTLLSLDNSVLESFKVSMHLSKAVYFRLFLSEILPVQLDKILFLDADLVVTGSLKEMATYKFGDEAVLGQDDIELEGNILRLNAMGFPVSNYFNAGVLLVNLAVWRNQRLTQKFLKIADAYMEKLLWWDQDILNMALANNWKYFEKKYNALHLTKKWDVMPTIIHYAGPSKPWHYLNRNPYKSVYWKYLKLTPFKNMKIEGRNIESIWYKNYMYVKIKLINTFTSKHYEI